MSHAGLELPVYLLTPLDLDYRPEAPFSCQKLLLTFPLKPEMIAPFLATFITRTKERYLGFQGSAKLVEEVAGLH